MGIVTNKILKNAIYLSLGIILGGYLHSIYQNNNCPKANENNLNVKTKNNYKGNNETLKNVSDLENDILMNGNVNSYNELRTSYIDKDMFSFLPWALVMSNKYKNKDAYFDAYYCLFDFNSIGFSTKQLEDWSLENLDVETQQFAIAYLKRASEMGNSQATDILEIYRKNRKYID